jgi:hypothetical protein
MVVTVLKMGKSTRTLIPVVLIQVRKELVVIRAALMALREMTPVETMVMATLIWTMETMTVMVGIRMTEAETPVRAEALMVTWDPVGIPMETPMVVLVKMETVTPVKKGTLMRERRLV